MTYDILSTLCGKQIFASSPIILQGFSSGHNAGMTGTLLQVSQVYNICDGQVVSIGKDYDGFYAITVQCTPDKWIRYCKLDAIAVGVNQKIGKGALIGHAHHNELRFEYCNLLKSEHQARIANLTIYKHDPIGILLGIEKLR